MIYDEIEIEIFILSVENQKGAIFIDFVHR